MSALLTEYARLASRRQAAALLGVGLGVWAVATAAFRLAGQYLLPPDRPLFVAAVFLATVPAMWMLAFTTYSLLDVDLERRVVAAVLLAVPGLALDGVLLPFFPLLFPNMAPSAAAAFGGLLLLAYATVLLTAFFPRSPLVEDVDVSRAVVAGDPVVEEVARDDDTPASSGD